MAIIPSTVLNNFLDQTSSVSTPNIGGAPRNAMVFTSTLRSFIKNPSGAQSGKIASTQRLPLSPADSFYGSNINEVTPVVAMVINPKSIAFKQPKRWVEKKTLSGSRFYHFTNSKGQNNDILRIAFKGNTGNIDRRGSSFQESFQESSLPSVINNGQSDTGANDKIGTWHNLYLLSREPMLMSNGQENIFSIFYISPLLPLLIEFRGFFSTVLDFEENADKPGSRDYSFEFVVQETTPSLDDMLVSIGQILADIRVVPSENAQILGTVGNATGGSTASVVPPQTLRKL